VNALQTGYRLRIEYAAGKEDKVYRVILSKAEWDDRLSKVCDASAEPLEGDAFEALCAYLRAGNGHGSPEDAAARATALAEAASTPGMPWPDMRAALAP